MSELAAYQQFFSEEEAQHIIALLKEQGIEYTFQLSRNKIDNIIAGETYNEKYELQIPVDQFERVTALVLANTKIDLAELENDHYLLSFTEEELLNVIKNPDEWGTQDYMIARELLKQKGIVYSEEKLKELRNTKVEQLAQPEKEIDTVWFVLAYLGTVWVAISPWINMLNIYHFWIAVIGCAVGISIWRFKKLVPDGRRVWLYRLSDRNHGRNIFFISLIALASVIAAFFSLSADRS